MITLLLQLNTNMDIFDEFHHLNPLELLNLLLLEKLLGLAQGEDVYGSIHSIYRIQFHFQIISVSHFTALFLSTDLKIRLH